MRFRLAVVLRPAREWCMFNRCLAWLRRRVRHGVHAIRTRASQWTKPRPVALAAGLAADLTRSRGDLLLENALLRQQVLVLHRAARRTTFTPLDRGLLVLLASRLRTWAGALLIIQPETVLRWHRRGFRTTWTMLRSAITAPGWGR